MSDAGVQRSMTGDLLPGGCAWIRRFAVRTPTLPPATHTNVYVVGEDRLAVIDPASAYAEERDALDAWLDGLDRGRPGLLILTHHHADHVSGASHLARRVGVKIAAHATTARLLAGRVEVDRVIRDGERLPYGPSGLVAIHTPGHAPGHLVLFDEASGAVIAGDMVASVGTIIIDPPEGDMAQYVESLERMRRLGARYILPAHGDPIDDPEGMLGFYIAHRLEREGRVVQALASGAARVEELVPRAYPDVSPLLYPLAARSLLAHLLKLRDEERAVDRDGRWFAV